VKAQILAIGSELLTPLRADTNAVFLTEKLLELGIEVMARTTVSDELPVLESVFRTALAEADLVISTGGLGPTDDDRTREAAAAALGLGLTRNQALIELLRERFARYGRVMATVNEQQADVIDGATVLPNLRGTAPGQWVESGGRLLVLLPGPPREMTALFERQVAPRLREHAGGRVLLTRVLRIASMSESDVEQLVAPIYKGCANPRTTILGAPGQVELHLTAQGPDASFAEQRLEELASALRERLAGRVFSESGEELQEVVARLLRERRLTLAVAESCTGGLLATRLTDVPGSSAYLDRGFVTYSNRAKLEELGVDRQLLETHGAVSEPVARAMAAGARERAGSALGVGITGIAGPDGGSPTKPVGLVFIALEGELGSHVRRAHFPGARDRVRRQASQAALELLRLALLGFETP
jgi:nicotinamide-nucleotide amidase